MYFVKRYADNLDVVGKKLFDSKSQKVSQKERFLIFRINRAFIYDLFENYLDVKISQDQKDDFAEQLTDEEVVKITTNLHNQHYEKFGSQVINNFILQNVEAAKKLIDKE